MRLIRFITLAALLSLVLSCSKKVTTITPAQQATTLSARSMVYALPATNLKIYVTAEHSVYVPGPYAAYAAKYLGIQNVSQQGINQWEITSFRIAEDYVADINALFVAEAPKGASLHYLSLSQNGLIIPIGQACFPEAISTTITALEPIPNADFTDLSHTPFIGKQRTTHYTRSFQDSSFVRVPVHKDVVVEKSMEEKAKEAAEFLFLLRKRRMELISGDADFIAEGSAVKEVFEEISRLEQEYLSLFIGKNYRAEQVKGIDYFPQQKDSTATILFRFSRTKGVLPASDLSGSPILIGISSIAKWENIGVLANVMDEKGNQKREAFYYRIPQPTKVRISDANGELYTQTVNLYQFSPLLRIPTDFQIGTP